MNYHMGIPVSLPGNITKTYDLFVPDGDPGSIPLLLWIHGGAWCGGEKQVMNAFERFLFHGFAVLSIDYRYSQEAPFPAQLIDCKSAVRWARAHAAEYGYNADKIVVGGDSAGGHLAALLGVTNGSGAYDCGEYLQYSSDVQAVVDEYGPTNLVAEELPVLTSELFAFLQNDPQKIHDASPLQLVTGKEPPFLIFHGTADPVVPMEQSTQFYEKLRQAGVQVQYHQVPGGDHGFDSLEAYHILTDFILSQFS